ncbi:MAG: glycosyltransferase family 2 protein, partial [Candidatus Omnitrophota bacterium]
PCFNADKYLSLTLKAVFDQTYPIDEVLIIDDGSIDDTAKIAASFPVRVIRHGCNKGLAAARNTAFRAARNDIVASLDADCVAEKDWLIKLIKKFTQNNVGGVGGRLVERYGVSIMDQWRMRHMLQHWGDQENDAPAFLFGSNTIFRKKTVLGVGGYNEIFWSNYEDVDLSKKICLTGEKLIYYPDARVEHYRQDTVLSLLKSYWLWHYAVSFSCSRVEDMWREFYTYEKCFLGLGVRYIRQDIGDKLYKFLLMDFLTIIYCCSRVCWDIFLRIFRLWSKRLNHVSCG